MAKAVKLADIAKRAGVSTVTVSKALADKSGVSEQMREKIKELANEMGYQGIASKPKGRKGTENIGILISAGFLDKISSFYWEMYQQIIQVLADYGYYGILEVISQEDRDQLVLPNVIRDRKVDGIIVMGQTSQEYTRKIWEQDFLPIQFLDFYDANQNYDTVVSDGYYGMYVLTDYLIKKGHEHIGFVGTLLATSSITDRYFGYCKAMMENGLAVRPEWVIPDREGSETLLTQLSLPDKLPTAFACNCDNSAYQMMKELEKRGYTVPNDISLVGFDNFAYSEVTDSHITTYDVNVRKMVEVTVDTLMRKIQGREYQQGIQFVTGQMITKNTVKRV